MREPRENGAGPPEGNRNAQRHGAHSERAVSPLAAEIRDALLEEIPYLRGAAFAEAVESYAWIAAQARLVRGWLDGHKGGAVDTRGRTRPAAKLWLDLERRASDARARLGLDPKAAKDLLSGTHPDPADAIAALKAEGRAALAARRGELEGGDDG